MSTLPSEPLATESEPSSFGLPSSSTSRAVAWSSFVFAILQSICTAVIAINGLRFAIGLGALVMSAGAGSALGSFHHIEWLRYTLMSGALLGSFLNLAILWQVRRLRNRPAARWRQRPLPARQIRAERLQFLLSVATLVLVGVEEYLHFLNCHTL